MIYSKILGTGSYLPVNTVTNHDLARKIDTSDEWIVERTGIQKRHLISSSDSVASMAVTSARRALAAAKLQPDQIDLIICASCSQDKIFPSVACLVQGELEVPPCIAFDVQAACTGFIYGVFLADQMIKAGIIKTALIIGSEAMSRIVNWEDRSTCVLFGDGAGACILGASTEPGIITAEVKADGKYNEILYMHNLYALKHRPDPEASIYIQQVGNQVFRQAVTKLSSIIDVLLNKANLTAQDIDWFVPHQANIRIIQAMAKKMGLSASKVVLTVQEHANTSAASIPLALDTAIKSGKIIRGQNLLLEAFGGGLTWGGAIIKY